MQRVTGGRRLAAKSWGWLELTGRPQPMVIAAANYPTTLGHRMRDQQLDLEVGRRVHRLVGLAIERGLGPRDLVSLAAEVFSAWPTTKALAPSARLRCVTAAATYLGRCRPVGFEFAGAEVTLEHAIADLVWRRGREVLIDELKTGTAAPNDAFVRDQVTRLFAGGVARWGGRFVGVRVLPLGAVRRAWLMAPDGSIEVPIGTGRLAVR